MARPLRIQYPNAWYQVMNQGRRGETIFKEKKDFLAFIDLFKDIVDMGHEMGSSLLLTLVENR